MKVHALGGEAGRIDGLGGSGPGHQHTARPAFGTETPPRKQQMNTF